ncbi:hypothetical protein GOP47_0020749 [Adiantum capillus-veneris]|uniref:Uncharacterized protein n=1 Tax=Adiantum capillus-veneris TaxID=13818 RepID=A0A9D4UBC3_ADICA|nr:hypothetical protein GOP47_0020749 [Adiantum capillus-veneris]
MKPRASTSSSSPSSTPVQKLVQMVSKEASQQLLFKFPDVPTTGVGELGEIAALDDDKPLSEFALVSCFRVGSCKQVHLGTQILQEQPPRPSAVRIDSFEARTPLLTPQVPRSRVLAPSLRRAKPRFKRHAHLPSVADKVMRRFAKGASKCKYSMRLHVVARRYKLRSVVDT